MDLNQLPVEVLLKHLEEVVVPRMPRGVRHQSATVLTVITCAVLSGAASYMDLGRWAAGLPQSTLKALGTQHSPNRRRFMPPQRSCFTPGAAGGGHGFPLPGRERVACLPGAEERGAGCY